MNFKLPSIHHLVNQNKKIGNDNPSKYIHVLKGHAFVNHELIAVVNLREYVKIECDVEEEEDIEELDNILDWFEGKSFTKEFWEQLVKEQSVTLNEEADDTSLKIEESTFTRNLHYQSVQVDLRMPLKTISDNVSIEEFSLYRVSFNGKDIQSLEKAFRNELKKDHINFEFSETGMPVKFCLSKRNFIFGSLKSTMNAASELMAFLENKDFKETVDEHLSALPPLPPKQEEEDIDSEKSDFDPGDDEPEI